MSDRCPTAAAEQIATGGVTPGVADLADTLTAASVTKAHLDRADAALDHAVALVADRNDVGARIAFAESLVEIRLAEAAAARAYGPIVAFDETVAG